MTPRTATPHWLASAAGTTALLVIFTVLVLLPAGWCLAHVSDLVFGKRP